jgi:cold shock protein
LIFGAIGAILRETCSSGLANPAARCACRDSWRVAYRCERKESRQMSALQGTVKWFNNAKGYGFIQTEEGGEDIFVHHTAIVSEGYRSLNQGERVNFEIVQGPKGLQARNVLRA